MLAVSASDAPVGERWTYEPKYDGVRVLALVEPAPRRSVPRVWLLTRNGNDKAPAFPAVAAALSALARGRRHTIILDGELVALTAKGEPARFQALQPRIHARAAAPASGATAFVAFDCLADGRTPRSADRCAPLASLGWQHRRRHLERVLAGEVAGRGVLRVAPSTRELAPLLRQARAAEWEGIIAKDRDAPYACGERSSAWVKVKLEQRQEFVVGGWTEPRGGRPHLGALLLGYHTPDGGLAYAGAVGAGMSHAQLARLSEMLAPHARTTSPFASEPPVDGAHWVSPHLVVEVRFTEWTRGGRLRHPTFIGVRDDKPARLVVRERAAATEAEAGGDVDHAPARGASLAPSPVRATAGRAVAWPLDCARLCTRLEEIEREGRDGSGEISLEDGTTLKVTHLARAVMAPPAVRGVVTKGALLRYYARMAPVILPALRDRALVLRRHTGALDAHGLPSVAFYQQHVGASVPRGVRAERVGDEPERRFVGGAIATLLHLVQLGAVSMDPWHVRVGSLDEADYSIVDLDPMPDATFDRVVDVALLVRDALDKLGLVAVPKTSGASGMHVVVPLPPGVPPLAARLLAEVVATRVAARHPQLATITRSVRSRGPDVVYIDYLQNATGKSVASVYSVRASAGAGVSTPLDWDEVSRGLDPRDYTIATVPRRVARDGDRWAAAMAAGNSTDAMEGLSRLARDWAGGSSRRRSAR